MDDIANSKVLLLLLRTLSKQASVTLTGIA